MKNLISIALLFLLGFTSVLLAQDKKHSVFINGGFEFTDMLNTDYMPKSEGGEFFFDSINTYNGRYSGCLKNKGGVARFVLGVSSRNILFLSDQELRLDFMLKSETGQDGAFYYALVQTNMKDSNLAMDSCIKSSDWTKKSVRLKLDKSQVGTSFILLMNFMAEGEACVWIDDMKLCANDELISEELLLEPLSVSEKDWLNKNVYPVKSADIIDVVSANRIVGIGEETHGSATIQKGRFDLIRYVAEHIDQHVVVLSEMMFIDFNDLESLNGMNSDLGKEHRYADWIIKHNEEKTNHVQLIGMDFSPQAFVDFIKRQSEGELVEQIELLETKFLPLYFDAGRKYNGMALSLGMPDSLRVDLDTALRDCKDWSGLASKDSQIQALYALSIELLTDCLNITNDKRDEVMAKIVRFVAMHYPDRKIFVLAHNQHVSRDVLHSGMYSVGCWLNEWFGDLYYIIGTTFGSGSYNIRSLNSSGMFERREALTAFPGSFEYLLNMADAEAFVLPLRNQKLLVHKNEWLFNKMFHRCQGAVETREKFIQTLLRDNYDAIYFIKQVD